MSVLKGKCDYEPYKCDMCDNQSVAYNILHVDTMEWEQIQMKWTRQQLVNNVDDHDSDAKSNARVDIWLA